MSFKCKVPWLDYAQDIVYLVLLFQDRRISNDVTRSAECFCAVRPILSCVSAVEILSGRLLLELLIWVRMGRIFSHGANPNIQLLALSACISAVVVATRCVTASSSCTWVIWHGRSFLCSYFTKAWKRHMQLCALKFKIMMPETLMHHLDYSL